MRDRVTVAVEDASKTDAIKLQLTCIISIRRNNGLLEDFPGGKVGIKVDVGGQDEVFVVIFGIIAKQYQVTGRGDLIRIIRFACAAGKF